MAAVRAYIECFAAGIKVVHPWPTVLISWSLLRAGHGMDAIWKMSDRNGMKDFKNEMEDNLPHFHTNSILDFAHGVYRKKKRIVTIKNLWKRLAADQLSTN